MVVAMLLGGSDSGGGEGGNEAGAGSTESELHTSCHASISMQACMHQEDIEESAGLHPCIVCRSVHPTRTISCICTACTHAYQHTMAHPIWTTGCCTYTLPSSSCSPPAAATASIASVLIAPDCVDRPSKDSVKGTWDDVACTQHTAHMHTCTSHITHHMANDTHRTVQVAHHRFQDAAQGRGAACSCTRLLLIHCKCYISHASRTWQSTLLYIIL